MKRKPTYIALSILSLAMLVTAGIVVSTKTGTKSVPIIQKAAQPIPQDTYFKDVKKLSVGDKPRCLTDDDKYAGVGEKDDALGYGKSFTSIITSIIPDMPAGMVDIDVSNYSNTIAEGRIVFSDPNQKSVVGDLKNFNYKVGRTSATDAWKLISFIACKN